MYAIGKLIKPFGEDVFEALSEEHKKLTLTLMANAIRHYENNYYGEEGSGKLCVGKSGHRLYWKLWWCIAEFGEVNVVNMKKAADSFDETARLAPVMLMMTSEWIDLDEEVKHQNLKNLKLVIETFESATGQELCYWRSVWVGRCNTLAHKISDD